MEREGEKAGEVKKEVDDLIGNSNEIFVSDEREEGKEAENDDGDGDGEKG